MILLSNRAADGKKLASRLNCQFFCVDEGIYPDGEKIVTSKNGFRKVNFIYFKFNKNFSFDDQLFNLLCLVDKTANAKRTILILPYLPYLRSYPASHKTLDKLSFVIKEVSKRVKGIYLVSPHIAIDRIKKYLRVKNVFDIDIDSHIIKSLKRLGQEVLLVSPDAGFAHSVKRLSKKSGLQCVVLHKKRISPTKVAIHADQKTEKIIMNARTAVFAIVDDIVSTGNTLIQAARYLNSCGVKKIAFIVVHNTGGGDKFQILHSNSISTKQNKKTFDITDSIVATIV